MHSSKVSTLFFEIVLLMGPVATHSVRLTGQRAQEMGADLSVSVSLALLLRMLTTMLSYFHGFWG